MKETAKNRRSCPGMEEPTSKNEMTNNPFPWAIANFAAEHAV
jgi:hypothetical protein